MQEDKEPVKLTAGQKAEASSAREVLLSLAKAVRALGTYLPNNPLRQKFLDDFLSRIRGHFDDHGDLGLTIEHSRVLVHGVTVYDDSDLRDNIAYKLFADGVRFLELRTEVSDEELDRLFSIIGRERPPDADDDIVTELWEEDFSGIFFTVAEERADTDKENLGVRTDDGALQEGGVKRAVAEESSLADEAGQPLAEVPQNVFHLSEEEMGTLRESIRFEMARQPLEDLGDILLAILLAEPDSQTFEEFLASLESLCRDMVVLGRLQSALHIAAILPVLQAGPEVPEAHRQIVRDVKARILTAKAVDSLAAAVDSDEGLSRGQFTQIISIFGTDAISPLCLLLGKVEKRNMRKALVDALVENGRDAPEDFIPFIGDSRWYLVRNTVHILRRIGSGKANRHVVPLIVHGDHRVRREVLQYFDEQAGEESGQHILRFTKDKDEGIRLSALKALARRKDPAAMRFLTALVRDPSFRERSLAEREAVCEAVGRIDPAAAVDICGEMLGRRHLLNRTAEWEAARCAVAGLRAAGTGEAVQLLREFAGRKKGKAGDLIRKTLAAMAAPGGRP